MKNEDLSFSCIVARHPRSTNCSVFLHFGFLFLPFFFSFFSCFCLFSRDWNVRMTSCDIMNPASNGTLFDLPPQPFKATKTKTFWHYYYSSFCYHCCCCYYPIISTLFYTSTAFRLRQASMSRFQVCKLFKRPACVGLFSSGSDSPVIFRNMATAPVSTAAPRLPASLPRPHLQCHSASPSGGPLSRAAHGRSLAWDSEHFMSLLPRPNHSSTTARLSLQETPPAKWPPRPPWSPSPSQRSRRGDGGAASSPTYWKFLWTWRMQTCQLARSDRSACSSGLTASGS